MKIGIVGVALAAALSCSAFAASNMVEIVGPSEIDVSHTYSDMSTEHDKLAYCTGLVASSSVVMYFHGMINDEPESIKLGSEGIKLASLMSEKVEVIDPTADHKTPANYGNDAARSLLANDRDAFSAEMESCGAFAAELLESDQSDQNE